MQQSSLGMRTPGKWWKTNCEAQLQVTSDTGNVSIRETFERNPGIRIHQFLVPLDPTKASISVFGFERSRKITNSVAGGVGIGSQKYHRDHKWKGY